MVFCTRLGFGRKIDLELVNVFSGSLNRTTTTTTTTVLN